MTKRSRCKEEAALDTIFDAVLESVKRTSDEGAGQGSITRKEAGNLLKGVAGRDLKLLETIPQTH